MFSCLLLIAYFDQLVTIALFLKLFDFPETAFTAWVSQVTATAVMVYSNINFLDKCLIKKLALEIIVAVAECRLIGRALLAAKLFIDHRGSENIIAGKIDNITGGMAAKRVAPIADFANIFDMIVENILLCLGALDTAVWTLITEEKHLLSFFAIRIYKR